MALNIEKNFLTQNPCYKTGKAITPKGLVLHSVGCSQPRASAFLASWNSPNYKSACVHAFIDANTGIVYQTLPWTMRGWHAGGTANNTHIGVEMCEPQYIKYTKGSAFTIAEEDEIKAKEQVNRTAESAAQLFAYLCKNLHLDPMKDGVILSHAEAHARGMASNHGDPEHLWKKLKPGYDMDKFRKDVAKALSIQNGSNEMAPKPAEFQVRVTIPNLNIRKGPGTNYAAWGPYTRAGVFTIIETVGDWGLLKAFSANRDGWISLKYAQRI